MKQRLRLLASLLSAAMLVTSLPTNMTVTALAAESAEEAGGSEEVATEEGSTEEVESSEEGSVAQQLLKWSDETITERTQEAGGGV